MFSENSTGIEHIKRPIRIAGFSDSNSNHMQKATELVQNIANKIMPANLPKTYKVAVFNEANKPLVFEERELQLPKDGEVSLETGNCKYLH